MAYKNKHIVNFGLSEKDYKLLMFLFQNSHCSSVAEFFRFILHDFYNSNLGKEPDVDLNKIGNDVVFIKDILYESLGVIKNG